MKTPNKFEIERLLQDPITFAVVQAVTKHLHKINTVEVNFLRDDFDKWKAITRRIIHQGKYVVLWSELERISEDVAEGQWADFKPPVYQPPKFTKKNYVNALKGSVNITDVAKEYGLKLRGNKCICPFHKDTNPSLTFSNEKGVFRCFGCGVKGDILKFVQLMEGEVQSKKEDGNKRRS